VDRVALQHYSTDSSARQYHTMLHLELEQYLPEFLQPIAQSLPLEILPYLVVSFIVLLIMGRWFNNEVRRKNPAKAEEAPAPPRNVSM